jgi:ABC-type glycerol-3-phosphate transport system substrate-binding protein
LPARRRSARPTRSARWRVPSFASCNRNAAVRGAVKFIPEFEEKYGIKVRVDEVPFDQYRQKSLVEMQQGTGAYDFYAVDVMWLAEYAAAGFLEPLMPHVRTPS